jgi:hypothetical protein
MTLNSSILFEKTSRLYSDSGADDVFEWIQSPINRQIFEQGDQIVDGVYMQVKPFEVVLPEMDAIMQEFVAWETASDEDFLTFEKENL